MESILTKDQTQTKKKTKGNFRYAMTLRYDDKCNNGHNTFAITLNTYEAKKDSLYYTLVGGGCDHDTIREIFPEYAHLLKWHLCSSNEPLYYLVNSQYWAKEGNLTHARSCAIWEDASLTDILDTVKMLERKPQLMADFKTVIESIGFTF